MTNVSRRQLLRTGARGLALLGVTTALPAKLVSRAFAAPSSSTGKLLHIFLRGGNDGINTLIPTHDAQYYAPGTRPTLAIAPAAALDLGNGGAAFHPALASLMEVHDAGELASIHRVGYSTPTLSHFSGQRWIETAKPGDDLFSEGFIARWAALVAPGAPLAAVSVSPQLQMLFNGTNVLSHIPDVSSYSLGASPATQKLLGGPGHGLAATFSAPPQGTTYDALARDTGAAMSQGLADLGALPPYTLPAWAFPADFAELAAQGLPQRNWAIEFFAQVRDALRLLEQTHCRVAGVELTEFDHHAGQGKLAGPHGERLAILAHALRSVRRVALGGLWSELVVLVQSEFGRTSRENGSGGTDHGRAGVMLVAGGRVRGGVIHCDPVSWPSGQTLFEADQKYVAHRTDFRAVLAEILSLHLGAGTGDLDVILPGWSGLSGPEFSSLGLLI